VKIHVLIAFTTSAMFHESGPTALNLNTTSRLLLNVLNISTSMTDYLSTKVKAGKWFKINRDLLLRPFALISTSAF
jgi:hypothetical protein